MRERLIELLKQGRKEYSRQGIASALRSMEEKDWCKGREAQVCDLLEFLADHLLENGVIVLPMKIGDAVWTYRRRWRPEEGVAPYQITNLTITQNKKGVWTKKYRAMWFFDGKTWDVPFDFSFDDIGKTVFTTRESAENALKKEREKG